MYTYTRAIQKVNSLWRGEAMGGASAAILVSERPLTQYASSRGSVRFVLLLLC